MKPGKRTRAHKKALKAAITRGVNSYVCSFMEWHALTETDQLFCISKNCEHGRIYVAVHHIFPKNRWKWHEEFNNHSNLIMLCQPCHTALDNRSDEKRRTEHDELVAERGLKKLFGG